MKPVTLKRAVGFINRDESDTESCLGGIFVQKFLVKPVTLKGAVGFIYRDESDTEREGVQCGT